jgi:hypothetical protein
MEHLERLIVDLKDSLERQLVGPENSLLQEMRAGFARIEAKFDAQAARMDREWDLMQIDIRKITRALEKRDGNSGTGPQPAR